MRKTFLLLALFAVSCVSGTVWAQSGPTDGIFEIFETNISGNNSVEVVWQVVDGQQCFDIEVQRSLDGQNWNTIYIQAGFCGGGTRYFWYDDAPVLYQPVYYRLTNVGGDRSAPIYFDYRFLEEDQSIFIFPHPIRETSLFTFKNPDNKQHYLRLYDLNGKPAGMWDMRNGNTIEINRSGMTSGIYVFQLLNSQGETLQKGQIRID
jgi:hypothetical protein